MQNGQKKTTQGQHRNDFAGSDRGSQHLLHHRNRTPAELRHLKQDQ